MEKFIISTLPLISKVILLVTLGASFVAFSLFFKLNREVSQLKHADQNLSGQLVQIRSGELNDKSITGAKLSDDVYALFVLEDGSITYTKLQDGIITKDKLSPELRAQIAANEQRIVKIENQKVTYEITEGEVTTGKIAESAVTSVQLANGAITEIKIVDGAVSGGKIADGTIEAVDLAEGSIITGLVEDGAIVSAKIADGAVTNTKIADRAITAAKIALGTITGDVVASDGSIVKAIVAGSGMEIINNSNGTYTILLKQDCMNGEILKYDGTDWVCDSDVGAGGFVVSVNGETGAVVIDTDGEGISVSTNQFSLELDGATLSKSGAGLKVDAIGTAEITNGEIIDEDISTLAGISWSKIDTTNSSLADLDTRSASDLATGNLGVGLLPTGGSWVLSSALNIDSNTLYIDPATNNIGLGTNIPAALLDLQTSTETYALRVGANAAYINRWGVAAFAGVSSTGGITSLGNVGAGLVAPVNRLDVEGGAAIGASYSGTNTAPTNGLIVQGNVGVGTNSPSQMLSVGDNNFTVSSAGNISINGDLQVGNLAELYPGGVGRGLYFDTTTNQLSLRVFHAFPITFWTGHSERMRISSDGSVGIGTASPSGKFHVYQDAPTANQILFQIGTSDDASRFSVDEDGDLTMDGRITLGSGQIYEYTPGLTTISNGLYIQSSLLAGSLVRIGTTAGSLPGQLYVTPTSNVNVGIVLRAHATQSVDLFQFMSGAGSPLTVVNKDGYVGVMNASPLSYLDVNGSFATGVATITSTTTLDITAHTILADATAGPITLNLPTAASSIRRQYVIKKIDASVNTVTIDGNSSETIDGEATKELTTQYEVITIVSNGSAWYIL